MLKRTFIHLPGVGPRRETHFWRQGLATWEDFLAAKRVQGLSRGRLDWLKAELTGSLDHTQDAAYFADRLQPGEHWRLFRQFRPRTAYLDIETYGKAWPGLLVTVVGLYDGQTMRQFVQGFNLLEFPQVLAGFDLLVTFNGTQFDLPVLKASFPELEPAPGPRRPALSHGPPGVQGGAEEDRAQIRHPPPQSRGRHGRLRRGAPVAALPAGGKGRPGLAPVLQPGGRRQPGSAHGRRFCDGAGEAFPRYPGGDRPAPGGPALSRSLPGKVQSSRFKVQGWG